MKFQLEKKLLVIVLLFCIVSTNSHIIPSNRGTASNSQRIDKIAVILDSSDFYDSYFIEDVLNGFDLVNQTYNIDYDFFNLTKYTSPTNDESSNRYPYRATYYHNNIATNHTQLATELIENSTEQYDLIVFMGYELRREKRENFLPARYPDTKFLFYDLSGELPSYSGDSLGNNVAVISFNESHVGFIAGTLTAVATSSPPKKIAMIGTYKNSYKVDDPKKPPDPRSWQLITGFQSGFLRKITDVEFLISFVDYYWGNWASYSKGNDIAKELDEQGYDLIFSALQNNNTLGVLDGFTGSVVTVDSNRSSLDGTIPSVVKNNTKAIITMFEAFNQSENSFLPGVFTFGLADNVFYPNGWGNDDLVNITMGEIYTDVVINKIPLPTNIKHAVNTPGFEIIAISSLALYLAISKRFPRKKRKR
ncbi:MAG: BMP family ABC transporter substrate-binding protein [Candidatus Hodarchaeales archaeon]|jgi:basic membrane lipoprotein Med (substrate-binding protein (PBP1-ABC) superfamily)